MRKILITLLSLCLLTVLAIPALAAGSASLSVSDSTIHRGDTFTVSVSVSGVDACRSGGIEVSYDTAKFELTGGQWKISGTTLADFDVGSKDGVFALDSAKKLSGTVFQLTFKVKSDAKFEAGSITVKLSLAGADPISKTVKPAVSCAHKFGSWSNASGTEHSRKCGTCGKTEKAAHTYDHDCDTTCNDCKATRSTTHSFGTEWVSDQSGHWHACVNCGERSEFGVHVPGAPAGEYTDQLCTVCNFVLAPALGHTHSYDEKTYEKDAANHWQKCLGCGEPTEAAPHIFDGDCDTTCDTCGQERAVIHKESEKWETSTQEHWKICTDCNNRLHQEKHHWGKGTVTKEAELNIPGEMEYHCDTCGAKWVDPIPALTLTESLAWWMWVLIGAVGGIVLTIGVGLAIILPNTLRKSKGRFSH